MIDDDNSVPGCGKTLAIDFRKLCLVTSALRKEEACLLHSRRMEAVEILMIPLNNGNSTRGNLEGPNVNQFIQCLRIGSGIMLVKNLKGLIYHYGLIVRYVRVIKKHTVCDWEHGDRDT